MKKQFVIKTFNKKIIKEVKDILPLKLYPKTALFLVDLENAKTGEEGLIHWNKPKISYTVNNTRFCFWFRIKKDADNYYEYLNSFKDKELEFLFSLAYQRWYAEYDKINFFDIQHLLTYKSIKTHNGIEFRIYEVDYTDILKEIEDIITEFWSNHASNNNIVKLFKNIVYSYVNANLHSPYFEYNLKTEFLLYWADLIRTDIQNINTYREAETYKDHLISFKLFIEKLLNIFIKSNKKKEDEEAKEEL